MDTPEATTTYDTNRQIDATEATTTSDTIREIFNGYSDFVKRNQTGFSVGAGLLLTCTIGVLAAMPLGAWNVGSFCPANTTCEPGVSNLFYFKNYTYHSLVFSGVTSCSLSASTIMLLQFGFYIDQEFTTFAYSVTSLANFYMFSEMVTNVVAAYAPHGDKRVDSIGHIFASTFATLVLAISLWKMVKAIINCRRRLHAQMRGVNRPPQL